MKNLPLLSIVFKNVVFSSLFLGIISTSFGVIYDWNNNNHGLFNVPDNWKVGGETPLTYPQAGDTANITNLLTTTQTLKGSNVSLGILNLAPSGTPADLTFGGGTSEYLYMDNTPNNAPAQINKSTSNTVSFMRRLLLKSDTVLSVTDGIFQFSGQYASLRDRDYTTTPYRNEQPKNLTIKGGDTQGQGIVLFNSNATSDSTRFFGNLTVESNGTLLVNNTFAAQSAKPDDYDEGVVIIKNTGFLSGAGTIERATTIQNGGTLSAGADQQSTGLLTFTDSLTLQEGARFNFALQENSDGSRGTHFNGINLSGDLTVAQNVLFNLTFDGTGSSVDFTDNFWKSNQEWLVFQSTSGTTTANDLFVLGTISQDSLGQDFDTTGGALGFRKDGNNIYLTYAIPEPRSVSLLAGFGLAGILLLVARRKFDTRSASLESQTLRKP